MDGGLLSIVELKGLHVIQGEAPKVYLPVLCIAELYTVVENARVIGAQGTYIHRLQSADTPIVLDLYACKVAYCIGHRVCAELAQRLTSELLHRDDVAPHTGSHHGHLVNGAREGVGIH